MSTVTIDYGKLERISRQSSSAADQLSEYADALSKKVYNKYTGIDGNSTAKLTTSQDYVNKKLKQLNDNRNKFKGFSRRVSDFSTFVQETDKKLARKINTSTTQFVKYHDYIKSDWKTAITNWLIDLKNRNPITKAIGQLIEKGAAKWKEAFNFIKHWYKCGGGKELIKKMTAIAGAIAAVAIFIGTLPVSGFVSCCAMIGAAIGILNAATNIYTSFKAYKSKTEGNDPAWAKFYGEQDSLSDFLRKNCFGNKAMDRITYWGSYGLDIVETFCAGVAIYDGVKHASAVYKEIKASAGKGGVSTLQRMKQYVFNKEWNSTLKNRGKLDVLKDRGLTKAKTYDSYYKRLSTTNKTFQKIGSYGKTLKMYTKTGGFITNVVGGEKFTFDKALDIITLKTDDFYFTKTMSKTYKTAKQAFGLL